MASDFLYTLQPPAGVNVAEVGKASIASNETYHVVGREFSGYQLQSDYAGEVHVYDANNGSLLRTIANPDPELLFHFGESVELFGDLLVVGTTGDGVDPELEFPEGDFGDRTGKAYLYNLATGALLHSFDKSYAPDVPFDPDLDAFGASIAIFGDYIAIGAPGNIPFDTADENDGHVFVFNTNTGTLLYTLANPGPYDGGDFGRFLALYDDKLVVSDPDYTSGQFGEGSGIVYVYDIANGQLQTTLTRPADLQLSQFGQGVDIYANTIVVGNLVGSQQLTATSGFITFNATTGDVLQKVITDIQSGEQLLSPTIWDNVVAARLLRYQASDLNRPAAQLFNATTGELIDTITTPNATPLQTVGFVSVFQDRLLVSQYIPQFPAEHSDVHVYSFEANSGNPPTDLELTGNVVVEHAQPGTVVGTLSTIDPDIGDTFTYTLTDSAGGRFAIDGSNLVIDQSAMVNFETNPNPSVTVNVTDSGGKTYSESFNIQITNINESPTDIILSNAQVLENANNNIPIGSLQAIDEDTNESFSYTLIGNAGGRFGLLGTMLVVANGSLLDYEQNTSHAIVVQVIDSAGNAYSRALTIQVMNVSDSAPTDILLANRTVVENAKNGTIVSSLESDIPEKYGFGATLASGSNFVIAGEPSAPGGGRVLMLDPLDGSTIHTFNNPVPASNSNFGIALGATDQYVVIGDPKNDDDGSNAGKVFVYSAATGLLLREIANPIPLPFQEFGSKLKVDGNRLIVRHLENNVFTVQTFDLASGFLQTTIARPGGSSLFFGSEFAIDGNLLAISDDTYEVNGVPVGRVYLYNATTGGLLSIFENPAPGELSGSNPDRFGVSLELSSGRLVIGASGQDLGSPDTGAIYVYNVLTGNLLHSLSTPSPVASSFLGFRIAVSANRIAAREANHHSNTINSGTVHLFDLNSGAHLASFSESPPQSGAFYGAAMAFVGEHLYAGSSSLYGQLEVFHAGNGARRDEWRAIDPDPNDTFTFQLLDDAGGRFDLIDNHLVVANSSLLNYEQATSHSITMQVTDSTGLTFQKNITISLLDTQESAPTDLLLNDRFIPEHAPDGTWISLIDNPTPYPGESFGDSIQTFAPWVFVSDSLDQSTTTAGSLHVIDTNGGDALNTLQSPNPATAEAFAKSYSASGQYVLVGDPEEDLQAEDSGRAYLFETATGSLITTLQHPNPGSNDHFGSSVAINLPWMVVGAENDGVAFVFSGATGTLLHELGNHTPGFGAKVLVNSNRVIVGSPLEGNGGRVYIYDAASGNLLSVRDNPNPGNSGAMTDLFGISIAMNGDKLLIGAPGEDLGAADAGAAYLMNLLESNASVQTLLSPTPSVNDQLGTDLSLDTFRLAIGFGADSSRVLLFETNGAFFADVGADPGELIGGFALSNEKFYYTSRSLGPTAISQAVHVINPLTLSPQSAFKPIDADSDDTFTYTLLDDAGGRFALQGDQLVVAQSSLLELDQSPSHTILVQVTDSSGLSFTKSLTIQLREVYTPSAPTDIALSHQEVDESVSTIIRNPLAQIVGGSTFGSKLAVSGDVVAAGSISDLTPGSVFLFHKLTGEVFGELINPDASQADRFGTSLSISANRILVGAPQVDISGSNNGAAYLFDAQTAELLQVYRNPSPGLSNDVFGTASSIDGTLIAISNRTQSDGAVELFHATSGAHLLTIPSPSPNAAFGGSIAVQGNRILVGAPRFDGNGQDAGRAYLYQFDPVTNQVALMFALDNPSPADGDQFGTRVAIDGSVMAIGSPRDTNVFANDGSVHLFDASTGNLLRSIANPLPGVSDFFGVAISLSSNRLLVGASFDSEFGALSGQAYVFDVASGNLISSFDATSANDTYGFAVSVNGNFHSVTSPGDDSDRPNAGRILVHAFESGSVIGSLSATDANTSDTFTYSLIDSAGGRFAIRGDELIVANGTLLDFESAPSHEIVVQVIDSSGLAFNESMTIQLVDVLDSGIDFGDHVDSLGTTTANNGARHNIMAGFHLGTSNSSELDGQPSAGANLDASDNGVVLPTFLIPGLDASLEVTASSLGRIDAFIDYSGDGVFTESERITPIAGTRVNSGANTILFDVPTTALAGNRAVRVRFSTQGGLGPAGLATNGEVEDYLINVLVPASSNSSLLADPANIGKTMLYVKGTAGDDSIVVSPLGNGLISNINGIAGQVMTPSTRIVIFGLGGNDQIWINNTSFPGFIDGGNGNDTIRGGNGPDRIYGRSGNDVLYGRSGDDTLYGNSGNDSLYSNGGVGLLFGGSENDLLEGNGILVGGPGADSLLGLGARNILIGSQGADDLTGANVDQGDVLIAGYTSYDDNEKALFAVREEWKRVATITSRIQHLNGTNPGGFNVSNRLTAITVFKEFSVDTITNFGGSTPDRNDWVFLSDGDIKLNPPGIVVLIGDPPLNAPSAPSPSIGLAGGGMNFGINFDVNNDGNLSPLDALLVVNFLNARASGLAELTNTENYCDVNGDGVVSPLDALRVINHLNLKGVRDGDADGEQSQNSLDRSTAALVDQALPYWLEDEEFRTRGRRRR